MAQRQKNIQAIDLSHGGDQNGYPQHGRCGYRELHRPHANVKQGVTVPIIRARTPTFSYAAGSQPQISFLNHSISTSNPNSKPSSDYDDDGWMDDFPSPSLLLDIDKSNSIHLLECDFSFQAAEKAALDGDSASIHADYEDVDNPATTLNDKKRKTIEFEASPYATDQRETSTPPLPALPRVILEHREDFQCIESDDRLFCSVGSHQLTTSPMETRKMSACPELLRLKETPLVEGRSSTVSPEIFGNSSENDYPKAKKRRVSNSSGEQGLLSSINRASQFQPCLRATGPNSQSSKGPQSLWVEESDPDIAEEEAGPM